MTTPRPRGRYFEEFTVGERFSTASRTVTEADIMQFADLTGDHNEIHVNAEFAANTPYGQRIAHGLLTLSCISGLVVQSGIMAQTIIAFREIIGWTFSKPVFIGDEVHAEVEITELKAYPRLGAGAVTVRVVVKNNRDETTQQGSWNLLVQSQPQS
jgi:acyl dehydratase